MNDQNLIKKRQVAALLGISVKKIDEFAESQNGNFPRPYKIVNGTTFYDPEEINQFINNNQDALEQDQGNTKQEIIVSGLALQFFTGKQRVVISSKRKTKRQVLIEKEYFTPHRGGLEAICDIRRNQILTQVQSANYQYHYL